MDSLDTLTLPQRVVLLGVAALEEDDETPAHANVVTQRVQSLSGHIDDIGKLTEAKVDRALNKLEADELVTVPSMDDASPTGKGRPAYSLDADVAAVLDTLEQDERLADALESVSA